MAQLTIEIPDTLAARFSALPSDVVNHFAVSTLSKAVEAGGLPSLATQENLSEGLPPVPVTDIEALRESLAEADRGQILDGENVMREVFRRAGVPS